MRHHVKIWFFYILFCLIALLIPIYISCVKLIANKKIISILVPTYTSSFPSSTSHQRNHRVTFPFIFLLWISDPGIELREFLKLAPLCRLTRTGFMFVDDVCWRGTEEKIQPRDLMCVEEAWRKLIFLGLVFYVSGFVLHFLGMWWWYLIDGDESKSANSLKTYFIKIFIKLIKILFFNAMSSIP